MVVRFDSWPRHTRSWYSAIPHWLGMFHLLLQSADRPGTLYLAMKYESLQTRPDLAGTALDHLDSSEGRFAIHVSLNTSWLQRHTAVERTRSHAGDTCECLCMQWPYTPSSTVALSRYEWRTGSLSVLTSRWVFSVRVLNATAPTSGALSDERAGLSVVTHRLLCQLLVVVHVSPGFVQRS